MVGNLAIATLKPNEYRYLHIKPCKTESLVYGLIYEIFLYCLFPHILIFFFAYRIKPTATTMLQVPEVIIEVVRFYSSKNGFSFKRR